ncbi:MAG TPA: GNAT family N-acetyltransferase [Gaiellaceae bacterium]
MPIPEAVARVACFPFSDTPDPPAGHPDRRIDIAGIPIGIGAGLPDAIVFPEHVETTEIASVVDEIRDALRREGRARGVWFVPEAASPPGLAARLQELGLTPYDEAPYEARFAAMAAIEPPPAGPPDVDVHPAENLEEFVEAQRVTAQAFGMDADLTAAFEARAAVVWPFRDERWPTFVAVVDGGVVGAASVVFGNTAGFLGGSATHPDYRGRGVYTSLIRARWDAAVARGTAALTVGAGSMSRPILDGVGFEVVGWTDCLRDDLD